MNSGLYLSPGPEQRPQVKSVLILDDHEDHVQSLALLFCAWGYSVRSAKAGAAALEALKKIPANVLIVDIGKRYLGGIEVVRSIRRSETLKRMLIVSLSGYAEASASGLALGAGCDFFFSKPMNPVVLQDLIRSL